MFTYTVNGITYQLDEDQLKAAGLILEGFVAANAKKKETIETMLQPTNPPKNNSLFRKAQQIYHTDHFNPDNLNLADPVTISKRDAVSKRLTDAPKTTEGGQEWKWENKDLPMIQVCHAALTNVNLRNRLLDEGRTLRTEGTEAAAAQHQLADIIANLSKSNDKYIGQYEGDKPKKEKIKREGVLFFANTDQKYKNAIQLRKEIGELKSPLTPSKVGKLLEKYKNLDKATMGKFSSSGQVDKMLQTAENQLKQLSIRESKPRV